MGLQSYGSLNFENFGTLNLGILRQNDIWVLALWLGIENTIRRKVVASPTSELWWVLWIHVCSLVVHAPKVSNYALTNLLFGLCRSVWIIDWLITLPSAHPKALARPSTPKMIWTRECALAFYPSVVFTLDSHLSLSKSLGVRQMVCPSSCWN
jgi:hypothetical protein